MVECVKCLLQPATFAKLAFRRIPVAWIRHDRYHKPRHPVASRLNACSIAEDIHDEGGAA